MIKDYLKFVVKEDYEKNKGKLEYKVMSKNEEGSAWQGSIKDRNVARMHSYH